MFRFGGYNLPNTVDYNKFGAAATLKEKMIELKLRFGNNKYCIIFRDSYLLLPVSLRKLAKAFNVVNKSIFPFLFLVNNNIPLNYIGKVPAFKYFKDITKKEYKDYCSEFKNNWSLRE